MTPRQPTRVGRPEPDQYGRRQERRRASSQGETPKLWTASNNRPSPWRRRSSRQKPPGSGQKAIQKHAGMPPANPVVASGTQQPQPKEEKASPDRTAPPLPVTTCAAAASHPRDPQNTRRSPSRKKHWRPAAPGQGRTSQGSPDLTAASGHIPIPALPLSTPTLPAGCTGRAARKSPTDGKLPFPDRAKPVL